MGSWGKFIKAVAKGEWKLSGLTVTGFVVATVYALWPLDLLTDYVLPVLGFADDLGFWGIAALLLGREKSRWEHTLKSGAIEVEPN